MGGKTKQFFRQKEANLFSQVCNSIEILSQKICHLKLRKKLLEVIAGYWKLLEVIFLRFN